MPQSLAKNLVHITFTTTHRQPLIQPPFEDELHQYIAGICYNLQCYPIKVGGFTDHIHILCMLSRKLALSKLIEEVKSHSSRWMKTKDESLRNFYWQDGYGAFSVNPLGIDAVKRYIERQHEHHRKVTCQDEFRQLLMKHKIEYDERYVWD